MIPIESRPHLDWTDWLDAQRAALMASQDFPAKNEDAKARSGPPLSTVDLSKPRYDQSTYQGRLRHFMETTNPLNVFASNKQLDDAATLVKLYKWVHCIVIYIDNIPYTTTKNYSIIVHVQNFRYSIFLSRNTGNIFYYGGGAENLCWGTDGACHNWNNWLWLCHHLQQWESFEFLQNYLLFVIMSKLHPILTLTPAVWCQNSLSFELKDLLCHPYSFVRSLFIIVVYFYCIIICSICTRWEQCSHFLSLLLWCHYMKVE